MSLYIGLIGCGQCRSSYTQNSSFSEGESQLTGKVLSPKNCPSTSSPGPTNLLASAIAVASRYRFPRIRRRPWRRSQGRYRQPAVDRHLSKSAPLPVTSTGSDPKHLPPRSEI